METITRGKQRNVNSKTHQGFFQCFVFSAPSCIHIHQKVDKKMYNLGQSQKMWIRVAWFRLQLSHTGSKLYVNWNSLTLVQCSRWETLNSITVCFLHIEDKYIPPHHLWPNWLFTQITLSLSFKRVKTSHIFISKDFLSGRCVISFWVWGCVKGI